MGVSPIFLRDVDPKPIAKNIFVINPNKEKLMYNKFYIFTIFLFISISGAEIDTEKVLYNYQIRQALQDDIPNIVKLMNRQAYKDSDKIVIVPEKFREEYIQNAVQTGRLFVALHANKIIGYKKLGAVLDN